jgi:NAD(P)-dependent dehydrogenase (short-subunit alcohol dehydrogenase family)
MTGSLAGRRVLVVGGVGGIGHATVRLCEAASARVAVIDRIGWPVDALPVPPAYVADVRQTAQIDDAVAAAATALGSLDGVVYCAGIDLLSPLAETRDAAWEHILDVNLTGAMRVCRAALRHFAPGGGSMVLVSSGAGLRPLPDRSAYCASKAGLNMLAKALASELAPRGIRVNALCPGAVETELFRSGFAGADDIGAALEGVRARYALNRIAEPDEIASAIVFLISQAASYVTGIAMAVDGGRTFH